MRYLTTTILVWMMERKTNLLQYIRISSRLIRLHHQKNRHQNKINNSNSVIWDVLKILQIEELCKFKTSESPGITNKSLLAVCSQTWHVEYLRTNKDMTQPTFRLRHLLTWAIIHWHKTSNNIVIFNPEITWINFRPVTMRVDPQIIYNIVINAIINLGMPWAATRDMCRLMITSLIKMSIWMTVMTFGMEGMQRSPDSIAIFSLKIISSS